jgi:hypothetical protein
MMSSVVSRYKVNEVRFESQVRFILSNVFNVDFMGIKKASWELDCKQATDWVLPDGKCIGCRVRSNSVYLRFAHQFALRLRCPKGYRSELEKILDGCNDFYFYGFVDEEEKEIISWFIGDMSIFRKVWEEVPLLMKWEDHPFGKLLYERDFRAFYLSSFPPEFIVACYHHPYATNVKTRR